MLLERPTINARDFKIDVFRFSTRTTLRHKLLAHVEGKRACTRVLGISGGCAFGWESLSGPWSTLLPLFLLCTRFWMLGLTV